MEKVSWVERKSNDEVLAKVGERKTVLDIIRKRYSERRNRGYGRREERKGQKKIPVAR